MAKDRATKASKIKLSGNEREYLNRLVRRRKVARGDAQRAEIVLRAADGLNNCEIAAAVGVTRQTVRTWRERFAKHRLDGLDDEPRCGAPRKIGDDRVEEIVTRTLETQPKNATHPGSTRGMAKASGVLDSRRCTAFGADSPYSRIAPRLSSSRPTRSSSRKCAASLASDLDPPDKALVICVDEKEPDTSA